MELSTPVLDHKHTVLLQANHANNIKLLILIDQRIFIKLSASYIKKSMNSKIVLKNFTLNGRKSQLIANSNCVKINSGRNE